MRFNLLVKAFCFCSLLFTFISAVYSQSRDFQTWSALEFEKKVTKHSDMFFEQEVRLSQNSTEFNESNTTIGGSYAINKFFKTSLGYRFSQAKDIDLDLTQSHRLFADLSVKYKLSDFTFSFRERAMVEKEGQASSYTSCYTEWYLRHRFVVKYNVPKISLFPYLEAEFFQSLNNPVKNTIDKIRLAAGMQYNFSNDLSLSLYYRYQSSHKWMKNKKETYILGTTITYSF